jgi:hypothetical protein
MIAVFAANRRSEEPVRTTATLTHCPPNAPPTSEMSRSFSWSFVWASRSATEKRVSSGAVAIIVITT